MKHKTGVRCPYCQEEIFSLHRHDFRRCKCGKVFVDGGDDYIKCGIEPPLKINDIVMVTRPLEE